MAIRAALLLLRATPPQFSLKKRTFPKQALIFKQNNRNFAAKSSLEPPDVQRLAETARITLTPHEVEEFAPKIRQVIDWFGQLQAVDLQNVEPAIRADNEDETLREDLPEIFGNRDSMLAAVPSYEDSYIKVPKVLNKE
ncbi:Glutamyl-tRNA(Gln) amidotransferase subunit C [Abeliophyllum distichum]|uniref:Glutamyl-tRNA(Gln) amidotransferase subunit C, chloroplastic/mitochondrial n=1 Tax=Abeliophyllum distichum TaxID=126358 RepID=A0ABD1UM32_9LAMI